MVMTKGRRATRAPTATASRYERPARIALNEAMVSSNGFV